MGSPSVALTAIYNTLLADTTLMTPLTGGIHMAKEISRETTPTAFDANREILPCILLKLEQGAPVGPHYHSAAFFFVVVFYQRSGYAVIHTARDRVYDLLHRQCISSTSAWDIRHTDDSPELEDQSSNVHSMLYSRYRVILDRTPAPSP